MLCGSLSGLTLSCAGTDNTFALDRLGTWDAEQYSRPDHALSVTNEPDDIFLLEIGSGDFLESFHNRPSMERVLIAAKHD
jgi:hypothetical protein